ncbi:Hypothetical predicted protein [Paramuricea clavata]|uniref:Uncharacterized protein n=1 Tax=Paramuricea clavata TaxID=317549 RepID=A0A7D9DYI6_PARCT|nr:Hypothetical predicted protein [Paramuricea clavata]
MSLDIWSRQDVWISELHIRSVHGQDTYSGKMFLRIWTTNSDLRIIGRFYLEYLITGKARNRPSISSPHTFWTSMTCQTSYTVGGMDKRNEGSDSEATLIWRNGRRKLRRRTHHADMPIFRIESSESD